MAHSAQARKRARQSEKRRVHNKSVRNEIKTLTKDLKDKVAAKQVDQAKAIFATVISKLDKAVKAHVYHQNTVARQKSKVAGILSSLGG